MKAETPHDLPADRRDFIRIPFRTKAEVRVGKMTAHAVGDADVSMSGLRITTRDPVPAENDSCDVRITLESDGADPVAIEVKGTVVRSAPGSIAVHFNEIDLDSYWHLHQLIRMNADDPEIAEREFFSHWGIRPAPR